MRRPRDLVVAIPQHGALPSLNVGVAGLLRGRPPTRRGIELAPTRILDALAGDGASDYGSGR